MQVDLATSDLSDAELEEAIDQFAPEPRAPGWGFADVFQELLSREPKKVPVKEISTLQSNLRDQGYLPPDHPADGNWGPDSYAAFNQFDRDNADMIRQGNHLTAATIQQGIRLLGSTLPTMAVQAVVGTAKGIIEQTPETLERGGLFGGAAAGAGVGAAAGLAGGPLAPITVTGGAIGGAIIGGVAGLLTSLFDDDPDSEEEFVDALHPFNKGEWTTARNFFEDVGYVGSVASLIAGGGAATGAARGATRALSAGGSLRTSLLRLDPVTKPGWVMNALGSAKGGAALGFVTGGAHGLAQGDDLGDVFEEAAIGGALGAAVGASPVGRAAQRGAARFGLKRINTNPMLRTVNKTWTGVTTAGIGGRYAGGLGSGEKDTDIEASIRETERGPDWIDYTAGSVLLPERIFPVGLGQMATGARRLLGETQAMPYFHVFETMRDAAGRVLPKSQARQFVERIKADPATDLYMREQYGIWRRTGERMRQIQGELDEPIMDKANAERLYTEARSETIAWRKEGTLQEQETKMREMLSYSKSDPMDDTRGPLAYASWLKKLGRSDRGPEGIFEFQDALLHTEGLMQRAREGALEFTIHGGGDLANLQRGIRTVEERIARLEALPAPTARQRGDLTKAQKRLKDLQSQTATLGTKDVTFVAARDDYLTSGDLVSAGDEYTRLLGEYNRAIDSGADGSFVLRAREAIEDFVVDLSKREVISGHMMERAMPLNAKSGKGGYELTRFLKEKAKYAGRDVELADPSLAQPLAERGYKLVSTGENVMFFSDAKAMAVKHQVGDYTKRASFFETLGLSPFKHTDDTVRQLSAAHLEGELQRAADELGLTVNGKQAHQRLVGSMQEFNAQGSGRTSLIIEKGEKPLRQSIHLFQMDYRQMSLDQIVDALSLDSGLHKFPAGMDALGAAARIKEAVHSGRAMGGEVSVRHAGDSVRMLGANMRVNGLTGFSDWMRQFHIQNPAVAGGVLGGVAGATVGSQDEGFMGAVKGGIAGTIGGAAAGYGFGRSPWAKGTYGYLPNHLHNATMALRYSLSFTFDLGRRMEQAQIASMKYQLPVIGRYKKYAARHLAEDLGTANGEDVIADTMTVLRAQLDDIMDTKVVSLADDVDRRYQAKGLTGFSQHDADAVYAHLMLKRGWNKRRVKSAVMELGRYGTGRTAFEKSANFVVFPFSFSKKLMVTLGDWVLQEPARALLIHEGMRQWNMVREGSGTKSKTDDESMGSRFNDYMEKYFPLAEELARLNNLAYGISPGRFFAQGLMDHKTLTGKVFQGLTNVFVPSGATTPLARAAGGVGDQLVNFFTPVVLTGEQMDNFSQIADDFAPAIRDARNFFVSTEQDPSAVSEQVTALRERGGSAEAKVGGAPWYQMRHFLAEKRALKAEYEDMAELLGYTTVDGFLNSDLGAPYKAQIDAMELELAERYPTGAKKAQFFEATAFIDDVAKKELAEDPNRSPAEEMILQIVEMENEAESFGEMLGMSAEEMRTSLTSQIRGIATEWWEDRRFRELWDRWFSYRYGSIARTAA